LRQRGGLTRTNLQVAFRLLIALSALLLAVAVLLTCYGFVIKSQAADLLKDLTALKPGRSNGIEARQFAQRHQWLIFQTAAPCNDDTCSMIFSIQNKWLSKLRLEPPAMFQVNFSVHSGTVNTIGAYLFRSMPIYPTFSGSAGMVDEYVEFPQHWQYSPEHYSFPTPVGKPYLRVAIDSHASPTQRQHAFDFSFGCLIKPGGNCDLPCDYLPSAWKDWKASLQNTFTQDFFDQHYPNNGRCER
jgi:hypothetical protein